ncbi:MAG: S8 family serine peptidase [Clostridiales bacterium]|jgi:hypothetical protein|nr:S8 family serine peptidase [Clostridiales bacterium]
MKSKNNSVYKTRVLKAAALIIWAAALLSAAFSFFAEPAGGYVSAAYSYGDTLIDSLADKLWYFGEDYLDIPAVRSVTDGWKKDGTLPDPSDPAFKPVVIAIIDSGIYAAHEVFEGVLLRDADGKIIYKNVVANSTTVTVTDASNESHGTHVASIAALLIRALGLSDYIKIMPILASTSSGGDDSFSAAHVKSALEFAVENGADVINMSFTAGDGNSNDSGFINGVKDSIAAAAQKAVLIAAAGNNGRLSSNETKSGYPAAFPGVIGVMAYQPGAFGPEFAAAYSNCSAAYDVTAPGGAKGPDAARIYGALKNNAYGYKNGTSMASPIVSVAAAVLKLRYIDEYSITASQTAQMLRYHSQSVIAGGGRNDNPLLSLKDMVTRDLIDIPVYETPESVTLSGYTNGQHISQNINAIKPVRFFGAIEPAGVNPKLSLNWYVNGNLVSEGKMSFEFDPADYSTDGAGKFTVLAVVNGAEIEPYPEDAELSFSVTVEVIYRVPQPGEVKVVASGTAPIKQNGTAVFFLDGIEYSDPSTPVTWYVNGAAEYTGSTVFRFTPKDAGEYKITAKYGDYLLYDVAVLTVETDYFIWIVPVSVSVGVVVLAAAAVAAAALVQKARSKKSEADR